MKRLLPLLWAGFALHSTVAAADAPKPLVCDKEGKVIPKFITRENYTFVGSTLLAKYPHGLLLKVGTVAPPTNMSEGMQDCVVLVPEESLPEAIRVAVGGFNSEAAEAARKKRREAWDTGSEVFPKNVTGEWPVKDYYDRNLDPFGDAPDFGKPQTWEEYQAIRAKHAADNKASDANKAATIERRLKAIADPGGSEWYWGSGGELELRADGSARHTSWKRPGTWEKKPDGSLFIGNENTFFTVTFDAEGVGEVKSANGKSTTLRFRSKKEPKVKPKAGLPRLEDKGAGK